MNKNSFPDSFIEWLQEFLRTADPGTKLPTTAVMARQWHVSEKRLVAILQPYHQNGLITRRSGKGTFTGAENKQPDRDIPGTATAAQTVAAVFRENIYSRIFRTGQCIPPLKSIMSQFHVGPATVHKAMNILVNERLLRKIGKKYFVGHVTNPDVPRSRKKDIFLFLHSGLTLNDVFEKDPYGPSFFAMETELQFHGYRFVPVVFSEFRHYLAQWKKRIQTLPYGMVFWRCDREHTDEIQKRLADFEKTPAPDSVPILIDSYASAHIQLSSDITILARARITRYMIRTLLDGIIARGKNRILCCGFTEQQIPMMNVLKEETLRMHIDCKMFGPPESVQPALGGKDPDDMNALFHLPEQAFNKMVQNTTSSDIPDYIRRFLSDHSVHALTLPQKWAVYFWSFLEDIWSKSRHSDTPWICITDESAAIVYHWAGMKGLSIPRDFSLAGMCNTRSIGHLGISTVSSEWEHVGYLMAHALIGDIPVPKSPRGYLKYGGRFIERDSLQSAVRHDPI